MRIVWVYYTKLGHNASFDTRFNSFSIYHPVIRCCVDWGTEKSLSKPYLLMNM
jgi:hypothetical protein